MLLAALSARFLRSSSESGSYSSSFFSFDSSCSPEAPALLEFLGISSLNIGLSRPENKKLEKKIFEFSKWSITFARFRRVITSRIARPSENKIGCAPLTKLLIHAEKNCRRRRLTHAFDGESSHWRNRDSWQCG